MYIHGILTNTCSRRIAFSSLSGVSLSFRLSLSLSLLSLSLHMYISIRIS